ncbi:putative dimethylallyl tryptophan synthase [Aspergillus ambiguus]|uniref:putative dimethylallyl tryptophan synthase n=1 Tax=Aspergillus ambiguus TaxID=176160 RepID=UPI003CCDB44C
MSSYTLRGSEPSRVVTGLNSSSPGPYHMLSKYLPFSNLDEHEWWHHVAPILERLLVGSDYDLHHQYQHLALYGLHVVPLLGPFPRSSHAGIYMNPLGSIGSLELSQNFSKSDTTVRLSFEPTRYTATTGTDLCNRFATDLAFSRFKQIGIKFDPQLYHDLINRISMTDEDEKAYRDRSCLDNLPFSGQILLGLDLKGSEVSLKLYLTPVLKSIVTGVPPLTLVYDALQAIGCPHTSALCWIEKFVSTSSTETLSFFTFSCDLVAPPSTRFKFYFAETLVTMDRMTQIWTLNGQLTDAGTEQGLILLRELWDAFQIPDGQHQALSLKRVCTNDPATAYPLLFNLEIHPNNAPPQVKIYFPVAGIEDAKVADALDGFFAKHGFCQPAIMYRKHLPTIVTGLDLHDATHLQMWVSFAYSEKRGPSVTVYYH